MNTYVAAEVEKTMNGALEGGVVNEPNDGMAGRVDSECAPGSSKDIQIETTSAPPSRVVLKDAPGITTDRRLNTPTRTEATERSNTGVHDEEPFTKALV